MKKAIRYILLTVCVCVFCYSAYNLINIYLNYKKIDDDYGELAKTYTEEKEEKAMFMQDLGIEESGLDKLIKEAYSLLGLRTYFTAGVQEVRAWTFKEGMTAPEMAGIIHSDFQRGFIKAETYSFDDLVKYGSEHALKEAGKIRQEGKQYVGQDGDIMLFKFNV